MTEPVKRERTDGQGTSDALDRLLGALGIEHRRVRGVVLDDGALAVLLVRVVTTEEVDVVRRDHW